METKDAKDTNLYAVNGGNRGLQWNGTGIVGPDLFGIAKQTENPVPELRAWEWALIPSNPSETTDSVF